MSNSKNPKGKFFPHQIRFTRQIAGKSAQKLKARREKHENSWFALSGLGLIGWSVVIPTLLGLGLGIWIDSQFPSQFSWTLMLMFAGLITGCSHAWYWVSSEQSKIDRSQRPLNQESRDD